MTPVAVQELDSLRSGLSGRLITAVGDDYDRACSAWNGAIDRHPAVVARCAGPGDVAAAVGFARHARLEISVRGRSPRDDRAVHRASRPRLAPPARGIVAEVTPARPEPVKEPASAEDR